LGRHWGVTGVLPLFQKALGIMGVGKQGAAHKDVDALDELQVAESILEFDNLELIGDIVAYGVANGLGVPVGELPFDRDALMDALLEDIKATTEVYMAFIMTMPRPKETPAQPEKKGKTTPRGKGAKQK
jgi:hypothetical protein